MSDPSSSALTANALETSMRFRVARQSLLSANVANLDTPGYRRVDLRFDDLLERVRERASSGTPAAPTSGRDPAWRFERERGASSLDRNGVDFDREVRRQLESQVDAIGERRLVLDRGPELGRADEHDRH